MAFHETEVTVSRDGKAWISQADTVVQYRFETRIRLTSLSRATLEQVLALSTSPVQDVCLGFCYDPVAALASR